jgi:hypothetical protein
MHVETLPVQSWTRQTPLVDVDVNLARSVICASEVEIRVLCLPIGRIDHRLERIWSSLSIVSSQNLNRFPPRLMYVIESLGGLHSRCIASTLTSK